jgi:hypothetical protein
MAAAPPQGVGLMTSRSFPVALSKVAQPTGWLLAAVAAVCLLGAESRLADAQPAPATHVLIVTGASGEPRFAAAFYAQAVAFRKAAIERGAIPDSLVILLAEDPTRDPSSIQARSTRENVAAALRTIARRARAGDHVLVFLIGHGSSQDGVSRFNLPGPDLTDKDWNELLRPFAQQTVAVVLAASASGDFVRSLGGPNRIVISATKSAFERNETIFGEHFVAAFTGDGADADKDGQVSLLEAFLYAKREVERSYEQANKLLTEHAVLDDDGDGIASSNPGSPGVKDGHKAGRFYVGVGRVAAALQSDPRATELLAQQRRLQQSIDSLRALRSAMGEEEFQAALEPLLVKLAETNRALRALEVRKP